jgi:hypothetical protein
MARAASIGGVIETTYWAKLGIFEIRVASSEVPHVVERLLQARRAGQAIHYAGQFVALIPSAC